MSDTKAKVGFAQSILNAIMDDKVRIGKLKKDTRIGTLGAGKKEAELALAEMDEDKD